MKENITAVQEIIEQDRNVSLQVIAIQSNIIYESFQAIVTDILRLSKLFYTLGTKSMRTYRMPTRVENDFNF